MSAASSEVVLPRNFDITKLTYGTPKQQATGGKTIFLGYNGGPCYLQTPLMKAPFGISMWPGEGGAPDKYSLDLSFDGLETTPQLQAFFDAIKAIDQRLVADAMDNSQAWFKKKYPSVDVVEALYTQTLRYSKDRETGEINTRYAPTFKMTLPLKDGQFGFPAFGKGNAAVDVFELFHSGRTKGARAQAIVQLSGVWIVGTKFGLMWKVRQLKVAEAARLGSAYAFQASEDDPVEEEEQDDKENVPVVTRRAAPGVATAPPTATATATATARATAGFVDETDEDDEAEAEA